MSSVQPPPSAAANPAGAAAPADGVFSARGPQANSRSFSPPAPSSVPPPSSIPSASIPAADEPFAVVGDTTPTDPFSEPSIAGAFAQSGRPIPGNGSEFADRAVAGASGAAGDDRRNLGRPLAAGVSAAASRQGVSGPAPLDAPTDLGMRPRPAATHQEFDIDPTDRLQDTEFKLVDKSGPHKPKEPNRLILGLAMGLVVLVGLGVAWFLTGSDEEATEVANDELVAVDPESAELEQPVETSPPITEPEVSEPTLFFEDAAAGPLQQGVTYSIDLVGEPEGSMLQVVVDDIPQGEPNALLPDLILPAGRHSLYIQMTNGAEVSNSTVVDAFVLGDLPPRGYRANLSSVDIENEGWAEAIRQFDEFRAAGHEGLQLYPLSDGYWNIFIGGLGEDRAAAQAYCESFGLAVPDQCFPTFYEGDPNAAQPTETTTEPAETTETTAAESMSDDSGSASTSAAGG